MALSVKKVTLWRTEVPNQTGELARVLEPLAEAGANLRVVMGYRHPDHPDRGAIELFPVSGRKTTAAAEQAGLHAAPIPCLLVDGDDRAGLGSELARAMANQGVNLAFLMAQTIGRRFSAVIGFASDDDADRAAKAIKGAGRRPARRKR